MLALTVIASSWTHVLRPQTVGLVSIVATAQLMGRISPSASEAKQTYPTSVINGLPFNKYTWLVTHNSFSIVDAPPLPGVQRLTFYNQEDSVTNQLRNGARGLMLDMYDFENDIWLCHSFRGQCYNFTAFEPAINTLKEVEAFLTENPSEIVTIIIEDYVHTPKGLTKLFTDADLAKYWFPVSKMPKKGEDWPTVTDMVQENHRLLVFTSVASKEADEGIAYQWRYMVENEPGDGGVVEGSCPNRKESKPLNSKSASLFLQNYFPTFPVEAETCKDHSAPLAEMVGTCYKAAGNSMPNFLAVNFYMRSDGGGVFDAVDRMNGQTMCGCSTVTACQVCPHYNLKVHCFDYIFQFSCLVTFFEFITLCYVVFLCGILQAGAPFGSCKNVAVSNRTPATNTMGSFSGSVQQLSGSSSTVHFPNLFVFLLVSFSIDRALVMSKINIYLGVDS
ncbi:hypothetical protein L1049_025145 [Liquidambar formosana]|uniref:PI-PLC X domain-containing protein n=1 Tax=Liquidambar formosana TaxID=63359 RepID=A0AAP0RWV5_LIQFO